MADDRSVRVRFIADIGTYTENLQRASAQTREFGRDIAGMGSATREQVEQIGRGALVMSGALAAGLGLSAKAAIDWETAWAGVLKTVDGTDSELSALSDGLRRMASELPATHGEIAAVAEAAGQLGIETGAIEEFTRTMIDLGETTNLTADQAATALARLANIMQTPQSEFDRMGSTIVDLGNNMATTEAEIVELSTRLAAAGQIAGLSEADVLGFAAALSSVGVEAEAGGTAMSKVFVAMRDAVLDGGEALHTFASTAGLTVEEFSRSFREDAAGAVNLFIQGLGEMNRAGESTTAVFDELGLADQRLMRALLSLAGAGDVLTDALDTAGQAWAENTALADEAEKRYETTAAQMAILRNRVTDLAIDVGGELLPALNGTVGLLGDVVSGMQALPAPLRTVGVGLGVVATGGLGMVGMLGIMGPKVIAARAALMSMGTTGQFVGRNMGRMAAGVGVASAALGVLSLHMAEQAKQAEESRQRTLAFADAIRDAGDAVEGTSAAVASMVGESPELSRLMGEAEVQSLALAEALQGTDAEWAQMLDRLLEASEATHGTGLAQELLRTSLNRLRGEAQEAVGHVERTAWFTRNLGVESTETAKAARNLGVVIASYGRAAQGAAGSTEHLAAAMRQIRGAELDRRAGQIQLAEAQDRVRRAQEALNGSQERGVRTTNDLEGANRRLERAQRDVADRQADLAEAQRDLDEVLSGFGEGSDEAVKAEREADRAVRDHRRRILDVTAAEKRLADARRDPRTTALERERAELDLADARAAVIEAAERETEAQEKLTATIHGAHPESERARELAEKVETAERRLEDALMSQADAFRGVQDAAATRSSALSSDTSVTDRIAQERELESALLDLERLMLEMANDDKLAKAAEGIGAKVGEGLVAGMRTGVLEAATEIGVGFGKMKLPGRALGGPVSAGMPYLVNEHTPRSEVFVPASDGRMLTNQQVQQMLSGSSGGGYSPNVEMTVYADRQPTEQAMLDALRDDAWRRWGVL